MNNPQEALDNLIKCSCPKKVCCNECDINKICNCCAKASIDTLQELIEKTEPNIHREIKLLHFLNDLIQNCRIYGGIKVGYIIVDNYKEHRGLGSIISCPYTYKAIREKGVNSMEPLKIIEEFYERGWVDDE